MAAQPPEVNSRTLSAAFVLVFRQGRSPPSCPAPDDTDILNRIRDAVPEVSPASCREALVRVRRLSFDALETGAAFRDGQFGDGADARETARNSLRDHNPGFSDAEYHTAFDVGLLWASF